MKNNKEEKPPLIVPDQSSLINGNIVCPKCGSSNFHIGKKGYGGGKALLGTILLGPLGLLAGQFGSNNIIKTCLKCGKKF